MKAPLSILVTVVASNLAAAAYDPLALPPAAAPEPLELVVHDAGRDRNLPLRVYLPVSTNPAPMILFSHGLGGNRQGSAFLGRHWSARGYVVVFLQHPGSDDGVWKDKPLAQRGSAETAFGRVSIPWLLMTGTQDVARIGGETIGAADVATRLAVFPALPPGAKYELVLHEGRHFAFTDRPDFGREAPRNPNHQRAILALSTAFWDAHLRSDAAARAWLQGNGPRTVLEQNDRWQLK